jgi:hypothetical protein
MENHRVKNQSKDVYQAVYHRIVYGRDGTLSFPDRKDYLGVFTNRPGHGAGIPLDVDEAKWDSNVQIISTF